jgi:hypothetical protein
MASFSKRKDLICHWSSKDVLDSGAWMQLLLLYHITVATTASVPTMARVLSNLWNCKNALPIKPQDVNKARQRLQNGFQRDYVVSLGSKESTCQWIIRERKCVCWPSSLVLTSKILIIFHGFCPPMYVNAILMCLSSFFSWQATELGTDQFMGGIAPFCCRAHESQ